MQEKRSLHHDHSDSLDANGPSRLSSQAPLVLAARPKANPCTAHPIIERTCE